MLCPCIIYVALLIDLFVLCVSCLTVFVKYFLKQFAIGLGMFVIWLLNVMDVFSVGGGAILDRPCMVCQRMCVFACDPNVHLSVPSIGFVHVFVCRKLSRHLRV